MKMFVLLIIYLLKPHSSYAVDLSISAVNVDQVVTVYEEAESSIILKVNDIHVKVRGQDCTATCTVNSEVMPATCNYIKSSKIFNILIERTMDKTKGGVWTCQFKATAKNNHVVNMQQTFTVNVLELGPTLILPMMPEMVDFEINANDEEHILSTSEGDQVISISIFGTQKKFEPGDCSGWCDLNQRKNVTIEICKTEHLKHTADAPQAPQQKVIKVTLPRINVTASYSGPSHCQIRVQRKSAEEDNNLSQSFTLNVINNETKTNINQTNGLTGETWTYIGCGIASVVLLIIIGQTICILRLKAKARKAEIDKNLTQKNSSNDHLADARYVKTKSGGGVVRESVIYEALDPVRGGVAPPPPPIETLPGTPRMQSSQHLSQSMASLHPGHALTTPRLPPPIREDPGKFNTVDRSSSLEKIKRRPPLPLPKEEIYEVMEVEPSPQKQKLGRKNITPNESPQVAKKPKNPFFGRRAVEPQPPINPNWPTPAKPPSPDLTRRPMLPPTTGQNVPGPSGRHPIGPNGHPLPVPMLVLPSMISSSNLKPVKTALKPSLADIAKKPSRENIWAPLGQNPPFQPPADNTRFQPPIDNTRFQPPIDNPRFQPPRDNTRFQPPRDNSRFQSPRDNTRFQPPRDNTRFQPPGEFPRFQLPAQTPQFHQPPAETPRFNQPPESTRFQPPIQNFTSQPPVENRYEPAFVPPDTNKYPRQGDTRMAVDPKMALARAFNQAFNPQVPSHPKPPIPAPEDFEQEMYYGSEEEPDPEFDNYDVLPDFRIYGNAPPKIMPK